MKTTGIGSLPFTHSKLAEEYSLRHSLPFIPELPMAGERFLIESSNELIDRIKMYENITNKDQFKIQLIGPTTFEKFVPQTNRPVPYQEILIGTLTYISKIQCSNNQKIFIQLDEPQPPTNEDQKNNLTKSLGIISSFGFCPIVHSCQKISVDYFPHSLSPYLALDLALNPQFTNDHRLLIAGIDPRKTSTNAQCEYVSFTCGMGLLSVNDCDDIFKKLDAIK